MNIKTEAAIVATIPIAIIVAVILGLTFFQNIMLKIIAYGILVVVARLFVAALYKMWMSLYTDYIRLSEKHDD